MDLYKLEVGLVLMRICSAILVRGEHRLEARRRAWVLPGNRKADFLEEGKPNLQFVDVY
jgi:hypothetical protein